MGLISRHHVDANILNSIKNNNIIRASIFEVNWILWNYPSYIEFAAYYGVLEYLKFVMNQGIHFGEDFGTLDILSYAIAGGHQDTINFLKNEPLFSTHLFPNSEFMNLNDISTLRFHQTPLDFAIHFEFNEIKELLLQYEQESL